MPLYLDLLILLNFLVDLLLILGTNRLSGYPLGWIRALWAAALGGVYGGICMLPGWCCLAAMPWRIVSLIGMSGIAFGMQWESMRRSILFVFLNMALGGIAMGMEVPHFSTVLLAAGTVCILCLFGLRGKVGTEYLPVEIQSGSHRVRITALRDTGNTLTDPVTGQQILVVSAPVAHNLLGIPYDDLKHPVEAMGKWKGLRLIPYHAVGQPSGMLLAKRFERVTIGKQTGSCLIAFAPHELGEGTPYEALIGGAL